jgi:hypothetical protein
MGSLEASANYMHIEKTTTTTKVFNIMILALSLFKQLD